MIDVNTIRDLPNRTMEKGRRFKDCPRRVRRLILIF